MTWYATHILIAADFFECAVLFDEWSAVFLPLGCQVQHPLSAGLHLSLQREEYRGVTPHLDDWMDGCMDEMIDHTQLSDLKLHQVIVSVWQQVDGLLLHLHPLLLFSVSQLSLLQLIQHLQNTSHMWKNHSFVFILHILTTVMKLPRVLQIHNPHYFFHFTELFEPLGAFPHFSSFPLITSLEQN